MDLYCIVSCGKHGRNRGMRIKEGAICLQCRAEHDDAQFKKALENAANCKPRDLFSDIKNWNGMRTERILMHPQMYYDLFGNYPSKEDLDLSEDFPVLEVTEE